MPLPRGVLSDGDLYDNIFWGVPQADTVLHRIGYSFGYSYDLKLATWVSYYSKREWVRSKPIADDRYWHSDTSIAIGKRAELDDYYRSGYDKGHLAMQADMRGRSELCEREACYLSNVAPQSPKFNRGIWNRLEEKIRDYVVKNGDCWIITGPVFYGDATKSIGKNKIPVPDAFYKIVADTVDGGIWATAFIMPNEPSDLEIDYYVVSIDSVEKVTGIDFMFQLDDEIEYILEKEISYLLASF